MDRKERIPEIPCSKKNRLLVALFLPLILIVMTGMGPAIGKSFRDRKPITARTIECEADNGGIQLPDGFCAVVVADTRGRARHLTVRGNGDVYVALRKPRKGQGIVALRDTTGDGRADLIDYFGELIGTGIGIRDGFLYFGSPNRVVRYRLGKEGLVPEIPGKVVVEGFPRQRQHGAKSLALDDQGWLYVNVGAPSNACQEKPRTPGSPGMDPCPQLKRHGGIWRFEADRLGQTFDDSGTRFATGIRNAVALGWNPIGKSLYVAQHGRDQLHTFWPNLFTEEQNAELPAEEFLLVEEGADFGWPYCYYDQMQEKKVLAPEYGGDGKRVGRCDRFRDPIMAFPGHWAPNALLFYTGRQFPERYHGGAFIAFHGSWNRAPLEQAGYKVVFVPVTGRLPSAGWEVFADGFGGEKIIQRPGDARFRPMGLAQGPDGSLYISDSVKGRIWRVIYHEARGQQ
jgi:glucose/arabinose dehydrogenase